MQDAPLAHEENCTEVLYIEDKAEDIIYGFYEEDDHLRADLINYPIIT